MAAPTEDAAAIEANRAAARADLATARAAGDAARVGVLEALLDSGGDLLIYRPERDHYGVLLGAVEAARHVAVLVPGVGTGANLADQWLPSARHLFEAATATSVILWKAYDNPSGVLEATLATVECDEGLQGAAGDLAAFVDGLPLRPGQTVTVVAHSFGSVVTGAALADWDLRCTDVVVAGSPGMTVDALRELHLSESHFFSEEAPGDPVAGLGVFGSGPTSPTFGGTRMRTNAPGHRSVRAHSEYFAPGSEALENIVDVVTGRYGEVGVHPTTVAESAGGIVSWLLRLPARPVGAVATRYHGPGWRLVVDTRHLIDLAATQGGAITREGVEAGVHAADWVRARLPHASAPAGGEAGTRA